MVDEKESPDLSTVFVISPIGTPGSDVHARFKLSLDYVIKKALASDRWEVIRADLESAPDSITGNVISRIVESDIIVADLSNHNPNVFYELAVAHGYRRPVVHIMEKGQSVPFDVGDQRVIFYDLTDPASVDKAVQDLARAADLVARGQNLAKNPLTDFALFAEIRSGAPSDEAGPAVAEALADLSNQVRRLSLRLGAQEHRNRNAVSERVRDLQAELERREAELVKVTNEIVAMERDASATPRQAMDLRRRMEELHSMRAALLEQLEHFGLAM